MKIVDLSETIAASHLKFDRSLCRQLDGSMKVCEYLRSRSFLDFGPRPYPYQNNQKAISKLKLAFSQKAQDYFLFFFYM